MNESAGARPAEGDWIAVFDLEGRTIYSSSDSEDVLGVASEELVGTDVFERLHPDDAGPLRAAQAEGRGLSVRLRHADGGWVQVLARAAPIAGDGSARWVCTSGRGVGLGGEDVWLGALGSVSWGVVSGAVAHEVNNLLTVAMGELDLLDLGVEEARLREALERLHRVCAPLTLSPRAAGSRGEESELGEALAFVKARTRGVLRHAEVEAQSLEGAVRVALPGGWVRQVLESVLVHASRALMVDYSEARRVWVRVEEGASEVAVEVAHTGQTATSEPWVLSCVERLLRTAGGDCRCRPRDGGGEVVRLTFPRALERQP